MSDREQDGAEQGQGNGGVSPLGGPDVARVETLPYRIELWHVDDPDTVERVLARAVNARLARAIFDAARREHPGRRITLRHGSRIVADSAEHG